MSEPIDSITWQPAENLRANHWNPNRIHKKEFTLLERSILSMGWIQPVLINSTGLIIDGFHRWRLSQDSKAVKKRYNGMVPTAVIDVPDDEAMVITIRVNRAKGSNVAYEMHRLVLDLLENHGWTVERLAKEIGASSHEVKTLAMDGLFVAKDIANWKYSNAWYPAEGPYGGIKGTEWAREQGLSV